MDCKNARTQGPMTGFTISTSLQHISPTEFMVVRTPDLGSGTG